MEGKKQKKRGQKKRWLEEDLFGGDHGEPAANATITSQLEKESEGEGGSTVASGGLWGGRRLVQKRT